MGRIYNQNKIKVTILIIILSLLLITQKVKTDNAISVTNLNQKNLYKILVDVEDSKLFLFEDSILIKTYKCSGGKWSTPSPIGTWKIISKAKWGEGFRWKMDGIKCSLGTVWNTWDFRYKFSWMGKFTWMHKNEQ